MALTCNLLRTCGIIFYIIFQVHASVNKTSDLTIQSFQVGSVTCDNKNCKYLLNVSGGEFLGHYSWRLTSEEGAKGTTCETFYPSYEIKEIETSQWFSKLEVSIPNEDGKIFFCLQERSKKTGFGGNWLHQGVVQFLEPKKDVDSSNKDKLSFTEKHNSDSLQNQQTDTQVSKTLKNLADEGNVQKTTDNDVQETKTDWIDLTNDINVNYLPNVQRPTREEKNDIEVLYHNKFVPLNDLIEQVSSHSKLIDLFGDQKRNGDANNNISNNKNDKINSLEEIRQEDKNRNVIKALNIINDNDNISPVKIKLNITNEKYDEEIDAIKSKLQSKCDKIIGDANYLIDGLNSLPNFETLREALGTTFQKYMSNEQNTDSYTNDNDFRESLSKLLSEISTRILDSTVSKGSSIKEDVVDSVKDISIPEGNMKKTLVERNSFTNDLFPNEILPNIRVPRQARAEVDFTSVRAVSSMVMIEGIRIEDSDKEPKIIDEAIPSVLAESSVTLRVYGIGLTPNTVIAFTHDQQPYGQPCKFLVKGEYMVKEGSLQGKTALFVIRTPAPVTDANTKLYICAKNLRPGVTDPTLDEEKYLHQGTETWKMIATHNKLLPLWVSISLILFCLMFSALFSGLNLGLMSLDRTELKIISNTGTEQERKYARAIMPVRDHGNYLLCSILLGNVAVNSTFTILLDELTSGLFAVIFSTLAIVMLGEITPQAICSRHGLMVGAKSIMITKGVMALTAPLSFPVSKLLDYFLGEEIGNVYNRERLKELVKVTTDVNDLDKDEVNIISGALEMRKKTVKDVMTKLEDVFMLPISSVLDFETMSEIVKSGYSRIPVYEGGRGNIVTVLFIKDLAFVDPDDNTPLRTLCQYYQNAAHFVFEDLTLDVMFRQFKDGHKGHMAFVHRINNEGEGDPFYETIGLVTLEDVIEEMIQSEIVDETDVFLDNRSRRRRRPQNKLQDFAAFAERHENQRIHISPQLTLATFQFLSTSVDAFRPDTVSETVLRRLLKQDVIQYINMKGKTKKDPTTYVFHQGKPVDYFLLILEGRVEVTVGRENLVFEAGPFTYFGIQALTQNVGVAESPTPSAMGSLQNINMDAMLRHTFVPDYSVRAITSVYYLTVKRSLYLAAKRATLMEKGNISKGGTTQEFDTEVDKHLCNSSSANIPISMISKKLLGKSTSTVSSKDDGSCTSGVKPQTRLNLIELMQVTQQSYPSSERLDVDKNMSKRVSICNTASVTDPEKTFAIVQCSNSENFKTYKDNAKRTETSKSTNAYLANRLNLSDIEGNVDECANFWIGQTALEKVEDKSIDSEHCKKKKATFHTDSSLLTVHNLPSTSHAQNNIDYLSINRKLGNKSNNECIPLKSQNIDLRDRDNTDLFNLGNDLKLDNNREIYRDDYVLSDRIDRLSIQSGIANITKPIENRIHDKSDTTEIDKDVEGITRRKINRNINQNIKFGIDYESEIDTNRLTDYKIEYKTYNETDSSNQEHKSINQEIDSIDPPDSFDRFFELERDTIDYEKEFREERLGVEKRRLETEQIIMIQLSKIIKMLERNQT